MRKKVINKSLLACCLLMSPTLGYADNEPKIIVNTNQGATYEFFLADNPTMTYQDNLLVCQNEKGLSISVEAEAVKSFDFIPSDGQNTGINEITIRNDFSSKLSGLRAGSKVEIFSLDAQLIKSQKALEDGTLHVDFSQLPHGVFIVKTEKGSLKIQH